jgi:DNA-binding response OmpR family regulator
LRARILVADDDPEITELLKRYFAREGWTTLTAADGAQALERVRRENPDLLVLDIMMPRLDGIAVCTEIRRTSELPILFLTAKDAPTDRIAGLTIGADDYVTKPFSVHEVVARVKAILRRTGRAEEREESSLAAGGVTMDLRTRRVAAGSREVDLSATEFELLAHFLRHPGQVFTREQLLRTVWKQEYATDTNTVMVHIRRLRRKLEENPGEPRYIRTVWGIGYRFEGG